MAILAKSSTICEQVPNPDSRISLGDGRGQFGVPLAKVDWRIDDAERQTLLRIAEISAAALTSSCLPTPMLERWAAERRPQDVVIIDMAHTLGTTRMSIDTKTGVIDQNCRVYGVHNLHIAGGSVFPTSGHANPTLMILALAIRLADHLNLQWQVAHSLTGNWTLASPKWRDNADQRAPKSLHEGVVAN